MRRSVARGGVIVGQSRIAQDPPQVGMVPGEGASPGVRTAASADPALGDSVIMRGVATLRARAGSGVGEDCVKRAGSWSRGRGSLNWARCA